MTYSKEIQEYAREQGWKSIKNDGAQMSKKYTIKHTMDLSRDERYVWGDCWALLADGVPVWSDDPDRMPSEDATLSRELGHLVELLNQEADKVKELESKVASLEALMTSLGV